MAFNNNWKRKYNVKKYIPSYFLCVCTLPKENEMMSAACITSLTNLVFECGNQICEQ